MLGGTLIDFNIMFERSLSFIGLGISHFFTEREQMFTFLCVFAYCHTQPNFKHRVQIGAKALSMHLSSAGLCF